MRVLHMVPDIGIANGIMSFILNYFRAMPEDIQFDICYFSEKSETRQADIEALGGRVFKIAAPSPKGLLKRDMSKFFAAHKGEWQALHIHAPHFAVFMAPQARRAGIKKICCHCHSSSYSLSGNSKRNKLLSLYSKYCIKTKFACSNEAGRVWYGNRKFTVINNAIDCAVYAFNPEKRKTVREAFKLEDSFVVGHIGKTDVVQKNHPFLIKVFAKIKEIDKSAKLLLIGAQKTQNLAVLCNQLGVEDDVLFLGSRKDVADLLQACDVFLFPSTNEGLPLSLIEAQAAGLPIVMSDSVTDELTVCGEIKKLSLSESEKVWAKECLNFKNIERKNNYMAMKAADWDINDNTISLIDYYFG